MIILLILPFLFSNFVQKWYIDAGMIGECGRILISDTDRDDNYEFIFTTYGGPYTIYFYELHLPDTWVIDSVPDLNQPLLWDIGDFDLDGFYNLVMQCSGSNPLWVGIAVYESPDSFSYPTQEVWRDTVGFAAVQPISAYDVDQDGLPELLDNNGNGQPHYFWIYESVGDNLYDTIFTTNPMTDTFAQSANSTHAFGDFDNDGNIEFVMGDLSAGSFGADYWVFESPANNTYEQVFQGYVQTKNIKDCFSVPDADGDGKLEFVVKGFTPLDARTHAFIFEAVGDNTYEIVKDFDLFGGSNDYYGGYSDAGDVDGDSIPEIVLEGCQNIYIIKSAGNDSFYIWDTLPGHASGSNVRIFDIDENGLAEIIISGNNETRIYEYELGITEEVGGKIYEVRFEVHPNPFRNTAEISFGIGHGAEGIELKIYDVSGRFVRQFDYPTMRQSDQITWDGKDNSGQQVPSGIYFVRLETPNKSITKKIIKLK